MTAQPIAMHDEGSVPRITRLYAEHERAVLGVLVVVLFLIFWEGLVRGWWADALRPLIGVAAERWVVKPIFISSPTRIAEAAYRMFFVTGEMWGDLEWSALEYAFGLVLAIAVGIPLGLAAGWYRRFSYAVEPFLAGLNATPQIAFLPLIIVWVGTGLAAKILIIFLLAVLPIAGIVVGEIYGSAVGVGAMINQAGSRFQTDKVFVGVLTIVAAGMMLSEILRRIEARVETWRPPL